MGCRDNAPNKDTSLRESTKALGYQKHIKGEGAVCCKVNEILIK